MRAPRPPSPRPARRPLRPWGALLALGLWACAPVDGDDDVDAALAPSAPDAPHAFGATHPLLPWPSDQVLAPDATTATGSRVALSAELAPEGLSAEALAVADGFSRITPVLAHLDGGFDPTSLPNAADWSATLDPASPVQLIRLSDGAPVPLLVETDLTAEDPSRSPLILRAHRPLDFGARYAVLLTDGLRAADGGPVTPPEAFVRLRDGGAAEGPAEAFWRDRLPELLDAAEARGIAPDNLVLAWSFTVRSEADVTARAIALQDHAAAATLGAHTVEAPEIEDDRVLVRGTLTVPDYLGAEKRIRLDADGAPVVHGTRQAPFLITIPATVTEPRPAILFGHGFFSSIEEPTWGNLFDGLEQWEMSAVTTEFLGFSEASAVSTGLILAGNLTDLDTVIDQQLQSHANFTLVWRLVHDVLADSLTLPDSEVRPIDKDALPYMGISNGGTQGLVLMTTSPVLSRGALVVPGGGWSHMLQRAAQWRDLGLAITNRYDDPLDLQVVLAMLQATFDPADSLNYVQHLARDRLPGRAPDPELLLVEAVADSQVANLVTRWCAVETGAVGMEPLAEPVPFLETAAPVDGALAARVGYVQYDLGRGPYPPGNLAPEENGVHDDVRRTVSYRAQMGPFLETGEIRAVCDGVCDPE
jgi:hypothetical protein